MVDLAPDKMIKFPDAPDGYHYYLLRASTTLLLRYTVGSTKRTVLRHWSPTPNLEREVACMSIIGAAHTHTVLS